jgi:hypothetical protein
MESYKSNNNEKVHGYFYPREWEEFKKLNTERPKIYKDNRYLTTTKDYKELACCINSTKALIKKNNLEKSEDNEDADTILYSLYNMLKRRKEMLKYKKDKYENFNTTNNREIQTIISQ